MLVGEPKYGGVCVYIHPERRYFTVEFTLGKKGCRIRECFYFPGRSGQESQHPAYIKKEPEIRVPLGKPAQGKRRRRRMQRK